MESIRVGQIKKLTRYPVKSMAGIEIDESELGWHGLIGDRRIGVRQVIETGGFPWISASKLPELLLYRPTDFDPGSPELLPMRVQSPSGELLDVQGDRLRSEIGNRLGCDVEIMALKHGIFDDAVVSLIASTTASHVCNEAGIPDDSRRFRANIEIDCDRSAPFAEDRWVGHVITIGDDENESAIYVTKRDVRCKMISLDPDNADHDPSVLKTAVRLNDNNAGVYGTVIRTGTIKTGDSIFVSKNPAS